MSRVEAMQAKNRFFAALRMTISFRRSKALLEDVEVIRSAMRAKKQVLCFAQSDNLSFRRLKAPGRLGSNMIDHTYNVINVEREIDRRRCEARFQASLFSLFVFQFFREIRNLFLARHVHDSF